MILAIDPGTTESAYTIIENDTLKPLKIGKVKNEELLDDILMDRFIQSDNNKDYFAIEMIQSYGMAVGQTTFETCLWIGRFIQALEGNGKKAELVYRKEEKMNLCNSVRAKDSNIIQALIDRFAPYTPNKGKGTKKEQGYFYGFKADIWQAYAVGITYHDLYLK